MRSGDSDDIGWVVVKKSLWGIVAWLCSTVTSVAYIKSKLGIVTLEWLGQIFTDPSLSFAMIILLVIVSLQLCLIQLLIYSERSNPRIARFCIVPITAILVAPFCLDDPILFAVIILSAASGLLWYIANRLPEGVKGLDLLISFAFGGLCYFGVLRFGLMFSTFMVAPLVYWCFNQGLNPNPTHKGGAAGGIEIRIIIEDNRSGSSAEPIGLYHDPSVGPSSEPVCSDDDQSSGASAWGVTRGGQLGSVTKANLARR